MNRTVFSTGVRDMLPILLGGVPFGLIAGVAAAGVDFSPVEATSISALVFAGASQLASFDLLGKNAPHLVIFFTAVIINLRFAIYSAAIAPTFAQEKTSLRLLFAFLLTDQAYALTAARGTEQPHAAAYYLGSSVALWIMWTSTTLIGAFAGAAIPPGWSLDFAVPLCFVALLAPAISDRRQILCAVITAAAALTFRGAPHGLGIIIAVIVGITAGALLDRRAA